MGLLLIGCSKCGVPHQWLIGSDDQRCETCRTLDTMEDTVESVYIDELKAEIASLKAKYTERGMAMQKTGDIVRSLYAPKIEKLRAALEKIVVEGIDTSTDGGLEFVRKVLEETK
jgi:hypothetical protein